MSFQSRLKHEGHSFHRFLNSRSPRAARKQENLLIDLIHFDFWGLAFQSAARYRKINHRQRKKDDDDDIPVADNSCRGKGCVLQIKHSASPPLSSVSAECGAV